MFNPDYENLPSFKSFVARQPADETYFYSNSFECACAKYLKSEQRFTPDWLQDDGMKALNRLAQGNSAATSFVYQDDWTYGKLLERINAKEKELA